MEECEPEEEMWSDDENPETDPEMNQESEEEGEKEDRPSSNLFIDAEADDSENEDSDVDTSIKIHLPRKSKTNKFEKVLNLLT